MQGRVWHERLNQRYSFRLHGVCTLRFFSLSLLALRTSRHLVMSVRGGRLWGFTVGNQFSDGDFIRRWVSISLVMLCMRSISADSLRHGYAPSLIILFLCYLENKSTNDLTLQIPHCQKFKQKSHK